MFADGLYDGKIVNVYKYTGHLVLRNKNLLAKFNWLLCKVVLKTVFESVFSFSDIMFFCSVGSVSCW